MNGTDARGLPSWMMPADLCDPFGFLSWPFRQFYFCLFRSTTFQNDYNYCYFTLFFSVFFSLIYNSRRRSPRLSFVLWKCRRKWRATRSAWLWLPPIVSTFSTSREESKWWFDILSMFPRTNMKVYAPYIMMGNRPCDWLFSFFFFFFRPDVIKETSPSPEAKPRLLSRRNSNISNSSSRRHPTHLA